MAVVDFADDDLAILRALVEEYRRRMGDSGFLGDDSLDQEEHPAPEVYIALVPNDGIPGMTGLAGTGSLDPLPGGAFCNLYRLTDDRLIELGIEKTVYNLSSQLVEGNQYILIKRDKFGSWFVDGLGGASSETKAQYINFTLPSALATTDATKAGCTVNSYWGGGISPGSTVTVYNEAASSNYIFAAGSGKHGIASYDPTNDRYRIIQMECP